MKKYFKELILGVGLAVTAFVGINFQFNVLPVLMLVAILFTLAVLLDKNKSTAAGASHEVAKSHRVEFEHIGGQDMPKREIMEALDFMRHREKINELGIRPLKGIILTGPPGTGKTLLAKAAASYTDSAFVAASGSEFVEMYVGVGASRVRDLFKKARMLAKKEGKDSAIVFIDEIDVIGGKRGGNSSHQEYDQTLNQLLTEMDGMGTTSSPFVLVVAATNRLDILDPALIRPGRFDRQIRVDLPDKVGRLAILEIQTRNKPLAEGVSLEMVARETYGFSGAQLEALCNEAAILALREDKSQVEQLHFRDSVDKVLLGERTGKRPRQDELERVSVHELGHAITAELVRTNSVSHITIAPRGNALGFVRQVPESDGYLYTKDQLINQIIVALGGTVSEELIYGNRSTGAQGDIQQATNMARTIVACGLSSLGIVDIDNLQKNILDEEIRRIFTDVENMTREMLAPYKEGIRTLSVDLVREENMTGDDFRTWLTVNKKEVEALAG
ncbi:AAA family ATPase [Tumebacillus permanentifrigoris]|uniref:ATP-dependent metalloprotease FtsH n=1 Tax=Tumebacillus permanentifrigoris TaxID=378543 RepID=A0A316DBM0_9BACL|nr:AAA family ATPase [Tumebacillus permanentifrigoris]PWK15591.1 ATP-dependent metalloprotease FtsH [Tumebacillus permanentifrigoris]